MIHSGADLHEITALWKSTYSAFGDMVDGLSIIVLCCFYFASFHKPLLFFRVASHLLSFLLYFRLFDGPTKLIYK